MKTLIVVLALLTAATASAQTYDLGQDLLFEPLTISPALHNARALSLGGAVTASVQDGSALWFNPAALARIPRMEISGDLIHNRLQGTSDKLSLRPLATPPTVMPTDADSRHTRLGSAYAVFPVPTYRGALTIAGGVTISNNLDRVLAGHLNFAPGTFVQILKSTPDTLITEEIHDYRFDELQNGIVRAWQGGFGLDLSPRISIGVAGVYYQGHLDYTSASHFSADRTEQIDTTVSTFPVYWDLVTTTSEDISGWGAHTGILFRPRNNIAVGAVIRSPVRFTIDDDILNTYQLDSGAISEDPLVRTTRKLEVPFSFTLGGAYLRGNLLFAGDISYTDWSQTEYKDSPVLTQYNSQLASAYREQLAVGGGIEYVIPTSATTLRAGLRWAQLPYNDSLVVDNQLTYSVGVGFLIDQVMAIDVAGSYGTERGGNPVYGFDEKYTKKQIIVTMGYRL